MPVVITAVLLLGLAVGSFLNVVIHRVPAGISLSHPPSRCPDCERPIRTRHNIPVLGWLWLRGRCADCRSSISARYPLVELTTALLFVAVTFRLHSLALLASTPAWLCFAAIGVALTMIDVDTHRLPNAIVLPAYPVLALLLTLAAAVADQPGDLVRAAIGGLALYLFYLVTHLLHPKGMGYGDVKLSGLVGGMLAFVSFSTLFVGAFLAFLLGAAVSIGLMLVRKASRKAHIPFGPFMIAGAFIALFVANPVGDFYSQLVLGA